MDQLLESHLISCLDQLDAGKSVDDILAAYPPETAAALRPMLVTFRQIRRLPASPTLAAQTRSEKRFLAEAARLRSSQDGRSFWFWLPDLSGIWGGLRLATAVGLLLIFLLGGLVLTQAPNSLPGDTLYGAKQALEEWRLVFNADRDALQAEFEAERRREVRRLLAEERMATVSFTGQLATTDEEFWLVADIPVIITTETEIIGSLRPGAAVRINGQTAAGRVWAAEVIILPSDEVPPPPLPTPAVTSTPSPTANPSTTPTPTTAVTPTATVTATNTAVPVIPPPPPPSNDNQNDNSSHDDNDNDNNDDDDDERNENSGEDENDNDD
jgi:hypothetical protein